MSELATDGCEEREHQERDTRGGEERTVFDQPRARLERRVGRGEQIGREDGAEKRFIERAAHGFRVGWMQGAGGEFVEKDGAVAGGEIGADGLDADVIEQAFAREMMGEVDFGESDESGGGEGAPAEGEQADWTVGADGKAKECVDLGGETGKEGILVARQRTDGPESGAAAVGDGEGVQEGESAESDGTTVGVVERLATTQAPADEDDQRRLKDEAEPAAIDEGPRQTARGEREELLERSRVQRIVMRGVDAQENAKCDECSEQDEAGEVAAVAARGPGERDAQCDEGTEHAAAVGKKNQEAGGGADGPTERERCGGGGADDGDDGKQVAERGLRLAAPEGVLPSGGESEQEGDRDEECGARARGKGKEERSSDGDGGGGVEEGVEKLLDPEIPDATGFEQEQVEQAGERDAMLVVRTEELVPVEVAAKPRQVEGEGFEVPLIPERKRRAAAANEPGASGEDEQRAAEEREDGGAWSRHALPGSRQRAKVRRRIWRSSQMLQFSM